MRGKAFVGFIGEGDEVELYCPNWVEGEVISAFEATNLTTNTTVRTATPSNLASILIGCLFFGIWGTALSVVSP